MTENTSRPGAEHLDDATDVIDTDAATEAFATTPVPSPTAAPVSPAAPASPAVEPALFLPPADPAASGDEVDSVYAAASVTAANEPAPKPTVRWGALVWALIFGGSAALTLWILVDPARRLAADAWITGLNPLAASLYALIAVGVVVAMFGIVGLIRRGERARRTPASAR
ncbi:hypothetical protein [Agromyces allii]|uniref:Uncharacterized protein n=1 Tax=Agromyces allii TaxID=393607 RepID=A0ABP5CK97_9MICO|nr:hypothetical protein [Agromyces allii]